MTISKDFQVIVFTSDFDTNPHYNWHMKGLGHNGIPQTYALLRHQYYWKGLKTLCGPKHVKQCTLCQKHNKTSS